MLSRDLGCSNVAPGREQEICRSISDSMQWTWFGHAIISPGWRPTFDSIRDVYCRRQVTTADLPVLESLRQGMPDWRRESAAENLQRILKNLDGSADEPENSIFHPKNPSYILRNGCR